MPDTTLPQLTGHQLVTDGGLETEMIFRHELDLPEFAAFPLVRDDAGRRTLDAYYDAYAGVAAAAGAGLVLEAPTWRGSPDWAARIGWSVTELDVANRASIGLLRGVAERHPDVGPIVVSGQVGPRGDGYQANRELSVDEAASYHRAQIASFAAAGADQVNALTITEVAEAVGIVQAARDCGLPVAISFTVETDGLLQNGDTLAAGMAAVERMAPPDYYGVNCAHPTHISRAVEGLGELAERVVSVRANASTLSHAELDEATELDDGDPARFGIEHLGLARQLPRLAVLGGCCGSDVRHVESVWQARRKLETAPA
jgi:homocysteine S-methyltransferase